MDPSASPNAAFVGSIPEYYHRHLGPLLFADYAADLAARMRFAEGRGSAVLELAAGTGILTQQVLARLPEGATLTATDLNAPMLDVARHRLGTTGRGEGVTWQVADATALPFPDSAFDVVVCQFGVMFFPDKPRAAGEAFRVLRPGGQWLLNVWGSWDENPFARIVHETIARFFPDDPPGFYRVPFGFSDPAGLEAMTKGAGFARLELVTLDRLVEAPSAADAALGLVLGNPVITAIEERATANSPEIVWAVAEALARAFGDHPLRLPTRVRVMSATRPQHG